MRADTDADGQFESASVAKTLTLHRRGQGFPVELPPRQGLVIRIRKESGRRKQALASDAALSTEDIVFVPEYRRVDVTVHNIGARPARGFEVALYLDDREIGRQFVPHLAAPTELLPQTVRLGFPYVPQAARSRFRAVLDPENVLDEITETNNRTTIELDTPLVGKKQHAHP